MLVFALFSFTLTRYLRVILPDLQPADYWLAGIVTTLALFGCVLIHELSHSLMAIKEGISIRKITLFIFGGVAQMDQEPDKPSKELKITFVGPLASIVLAFLFGVLHFSLLYGRASSNLFIESLGFLFRINLLMAFFNLIPAFPLDGGRLLRAVIWYFKRNLLVATRVAVSIGSVFAFMAIGLGFITVFIYGFWGIWYIFLGWMLFQAGQASYTQLIFRETFAGVKVSEIMSRDLHTVPPDMPIQELIDKFYSYKFGAFPVTYGSTVHGIVSLNQVKEIPPEKWPFATVAYIMTPLKNIAVVAPDQEAVEVMMNMAVNNHGRVLVMEKSNLVGILSRTDMMRLLKMHMILGAN